MNNISLKEMQKNILIYESQASYPECIKKEYDEDEKFVFSKMLLYLKNHFSRYFVFNDDAIELLCQVLGHDSVLISEFLLKHLKKKDRTKFVKELEDSSPENEDYPNILLRMLKKTSPKVIKRFKQFFEDLLVSRIQYFQSDNISDIEKNISQLKKMFKLSEQEIEFLIFLFIIKVYEKAELFFDSYLQCRNFSGKKHLHNILKNDQTAVNQILNGSIKSIGIIDFNYNSDIELDNDFLPWFQNPSKELLTKKLYSKLSKKALPLSNFFIEQDKKEYVLNLMKNKPASSTHMLLYGQPGTGKTSFAYSISQTLGVPSYEILGSEDNQSIDRQVAVTACLNMTNSGSGSIIIVDEADNILNTQMSWFMRGETQDKGCLNKLLDKSGSRIIWITNHIENIESSVLRRFAYSIHFKPFNRVQRIKLWENILCKNRCRNLININEITNLSKKYIISAGAIDIAVKKAIELTPKSKTIFLKSLDISISAHQNLMNQGNTPVDKEQVDKNYSLDGLNIKTDINKVIKQLVKFDQYLRKTDRNNICNMNLLFWGPPGTGKSELARYLADQLDRQIICKRISDIQSKWVGDSEKNIKMVFEEAEREDAVLIVDEADSLLFKRESASHSWEISFINEFLTQMERFKGILICTTNQEKELDKASIRRFNQKIGFDYLDSTGNIIFYNKMLRPLLNSDLSKINKKSLQCLTCLTPGDFKTVRDNFSFYPAEELKHKSLIEALRFEANFKKADRGNQKIGFRS